MVSGKGIKMTRKCLFTYGYLCNDRSNKKKSILQVEHVHFTYNVNPNLYYVKCTFKESSS